MASGEVPVSSKWVHNSRRRSSRSTRLGMCAPATMRSMNAATVSRSSMGLTENGAHRRRNADPLPPFRCRPAATLGCEAVVLASPAGRALAPRRLEQTRALHLVKRWVDRPFLQLERLRAAELRFLHDLVAIHRALGQEAQDQDPDRASQELAIVLHTRHLLSCWARYHTLVSKTTGLESRRRWT